jgi:hypothetical protein
MEAPLTQRPDLSIGVTAVRRETGGTTQRTLIPPQRAFIQAELHRTVDADVLLLSYDLAEAEVRKSTQWRRRVPEQVTLGDVLEEPGVTVPNSRLTIATLEAARTPARDLEVRRIVGCVGTVLFVVSGISQVRLSGPATPHRQSLGELRCR